MRLPGWLFGDVDDVAVFELVGHAYAFASVAALVFVVGGGVAVYLLSLFGDYLHVLLSGVLDHGEVLLREHLGHVVTAHKCHHQRHGKYHGNVEQVADHAHRVGVLALAE